MELQVPGAEENEGVVSQPSQQLAGTLDVDLLRNRLLGFKNNPGKQVRVA